MSAGPGLRERKKQQTRHLLERTARRLFAERGFEQVSVAEIATAADVSEATVYNYFPTKEDLIYGRMQTFEDDLLQAIRERPTGEPVLAAFRRFVLQPRGLLAATDTSAAKDLANLSQLIATSPALLAREAQILARYTDALTGVIADETGANRDDPRPRVAANALIGVHRALITQLRQRILTSHDSLPAIASDLRSNAETALAFLAGGLGAYAPKPPAKTPAPEPDDYWPKSNKCARGVDE